MGPQVQKETRPSEGGGASRVDGAALLQALDLLAALLDLPQRANELIAHLLLTRLFVCSHLSKERSG